MKVLGIMGSPRIKGNTDLLLDEALKGAQSQGAEVEKITVANLKIAPCREIYACLKDGNCAIRDDMDGIYLKILAADAVIIASPIFFYTVSAQLMPLNQPLPGALVEKICPEKNGYPAEKRRFYCRRGDEGRETV